MSSSMLLMLVGLLGCLLPAVLAIRTNVSAVPSNTSSSSSPPLSRNATAPSAPALHATPNMCPGYTTSQYRGCPSGQVCKSVYEPGKDYCSFGTCWAWTDRRHCESGDTLITDTTCTWSCPSQPVCAICADPCNPTAVSVTVLPTSYPTTPESLTPAGASITSTTLAINRGSVPQSVTLTFTFTYTVSSTLTFTKAFSFSEKATARIGVPLIGDTGLEFSSTQSFTSGEATTSSQTTTMTLVISQQVPPYTQQNVSAKAFIGTVIAKVPVQVVSTFTCDKASTTEDNTAIITTTGALLTQSSDLRLEYGSTAPAYPDNILPQADGSCESNPICSLNGITGQCCPNALGVFNACCSFCVAKPACAAYAQDNATMCCPSRGNVLNTCCTKALKAPSDASLPTGV